MPSISDKVTNALNVVLYKFSSESWCCFDKHSKSQYQETVNCKRLYDKTCISRDCVVCYFGNLSGRMNFTETGTTTEI